VHCCSALPGAILRASDARCTVNGGSFPRNAKRRHAQPRTTPVSLSEPRQLLPRLLRQLGSTTVSITWITPLLAMTSVLMTFASFTRTPLLDARMLSG